jgi:pilus assembly protein Flp/PilA
VALTAAWAAPAADPDWPQRRASARFGAPQPGGRSFGCSAVFTDAPQRDLTTESFSRNGGTFIDRINGHEMWRLLGSTSRFGPVQKKGRRAGQTATRQLKEPQMKKLVSRFVKDESGATAIEYGLIAAGISVAIIAVVQGLGTKLKSTFDSVSAALN